MISIVVSSKSLSDFEALAKNIDDTIGVSHEIIRVENPKGHLSLCAAYNKGAAESKFPYLCFVHEDVKFHTNNWGNNAISHFLAGKDTGLIGISGGIYKKRMFSGLGEFETDSVNIKRINIIQHFKYTSIPPVHVIENPQNEKGKAQVVSIDGVFLFTTKDIWKANKFDEKLLKGFHGYDLDFSLQIGRTKKLFVVYDILLEHFSEGKCDMTWELAIIDVHKKWRKYLPVTTDLSIAEGVDIYNNDWDKVRLTLTTYINNGYHYLPLFKLYHSLFSLINYEDKKHAILKDYWMEWFKISKQFFENTRHD